MVKNRKLYPDVFTQALKEQFVIFLYALRDADPSRRRGTYFSTYFCRAQRTGVYIYHRPTCARHPLCGSRLYRFKEKVTDGASGEEEPSDKVCEAADAPQSFKSVVRKHFVFPAWQVADRQIQHAQKVPRYDYRTPTALCFAPMVV